MDTMTTAPRRGTEISSLERRNRRLVILAVVLGVIAVAAGGWLLYDTVSATETRLPAQAQVVFDDYLAAWNTYDGDALLAVTTEDFEFYEAEDLTSPMTLHSRTGTVQIVEQNVGANWSVEIVGTPQALGEDTITLVTADQIDTTTESGEGFSIYTIVQEGGEWKIDQHVFLYS